MADLLIRNIDEDLKRELTARAARNGRSQQAEALSILQSALSNSSRSWVSLLSRAGDRADEITLPEIERHPARSTSVEGWL